MCGGEGEGGEAQGRAADEGLGGFAEPGGEVRDVM
jgi:hypothetical protein